MMQADLFAAVPRETRAEAQAVAGMARSLDHADDEAPGWADVAFAFLRRYAATHQAFISEDVSDASIVWGMVQPPTLRAWGAIYRRAQKEGIITMSGTGKSRLRHGSVCPQWSAKHGKS